MKNKYVTPDIEIVLLQQQDGLLAVSVLEGGEAGAPALFPTDDAAYEDEILE